jgi:hypothetical protein
VQHKADLLLPDGVHPGEGLGVARPDSASCSLCFHVLDPDRSWLRLVHVAMAVAVTVACLSRRCAVLQQALGKAALPVHHIFGALGAVRFGWSGPVAAGRSGHLGLAL